MKELDKGREWEGRWGGKERKGEWLNYAYQKLPTFQTSHQPSNQMSWMLQEDPNEYLSLQAIIGSTGLAEGVSLYRSYSGHIAKSASHLVNHLILPKICHQQCETDNRLCHGDTPSHTGGYGIANLLMHWDLGPAQIQHIKLCGVCVEVNNHPTFPKAKSVPRRKEYIQGESRW